MIGRRITAEQAENMANIEPGDYWYDPKRNGWYAACPTPKDSDGLIACLAFLFRHNVEENPDGTITVTPSILVSAEGSTAPKAWKDEHYYHGWLTAGEWITA